MQRKNFLKNKNILVTGAAGSIGSALCRKIAKLQPKKLILLDQDETGLFDIYEELKNKRVVLEIANIRDNWKIRTIFKDYRPDIVFHCAALKHVKICEEHPDEAWNTNVYGFKNVADNACLYDAKKFVFISTDKAVNPSCVMGHTKKQGEELCKKYNGLTKFCFVRFGNVLNSRGSLLPILRKQIEEGKPITITDKRMERYFMTIPEACGLILEAAERSDGIGYVLDMGKRHSILELAKWMIRFSGKDLPIKITGANKGEKFSEVLMTKEERKKCKKIGKLYVIPR